MLFFYPKGADTIRKVTFTNEVNGLSVTFSTDTPMMFLEKLDGCSCGSSAVTYKPLDFDGQRFISSALNPRTIQLTINFGGRSGKLYSRSEALKRWEEIQKTLVPGQMGTLTWTDGINSRFIRCRCGDLPLPTEILPFLFRAGFSLVADIPYWKDSAENVVDFGGSGSGEVVINNDCGIAVPVIIEVGTADDIFLLANRTTGEALGFAEDLGEGFTIDTENCTVTTDSGELVNHKLLIDSSFFYLAPGENTLKFMDYTSGVVLRWRRAFMGVY